MIDAARSYRELFEQLLFERALAGGRLSQEREAALATELDPLWHAMSEAEQDAAEARFAKDVEPPAPDDFLFFDVAVAEGGHSVPRRAA